MGTSLYHHWPETDRTCFKFQKEYYLYWPEKDRTCFECQNAYR